MGKSTTFGEIRPTVSAGRASVRRPFLTAEEECGYARRAGTGCRECRERLIESHLPLVVSIARRYRLDSCALEDAVQDGFLGLIKAVDRFDVNKGVRLSTYAGWWIRRGIQLGLRQRDAFRMPNGARHGRSSREPTLRRLIETVPLDEGISDRLSSNGDEIGLEYALHGQFVQVIGDALADLPARERSILIMRFGLFGDHERTLSEVGATLGVSRERVRQIEQTALCRLKIGPKSDALAALIDET
ncbi:MAG: sigma-70 family RNA polymerase sigma factor [Armatimonadetes bacterium]|nr:sigma-70 family RNA polymerase sigma factor [Armatimonadota bacterium]